MRHSLALALLACASPVLAETAPPATPPGSPMTAAAFEAYVTGKTLTYAQGGRIYGTEQYKPDRKVVWAFTEEECREGYWFAQGPQICFVYEDPNDPQCWLFYSRADGMWARFVGDAADAPLSQVSPSQGPLSCAGPNVGA